MRKAPLIIKRGGFSLVEAILAGSVFSLMVTAFAGALVYGEMSTALSGLRIRAVFLADEALEAVRNMRDASYTNLTDGPHGLAISGNQWIFSGTGDTSGIFTRQITVATVDTNTKSITANVTWQENLQRVDTITLTTYLTRWR